MVIASVIRLSVPRQASKSKRDSCEIYRKSELLSNNMTSDLALEVTPNPKVAQNGSVQAYCLAPLAMQLVIVSTMLDGWPETKSPQWPVVMACEL